ncbi:hypothetical protein OH76DRAFT_695293 [Lentinus brumalis]|uniref:Uncharacterized protein n=1 Tax=Lentinus brumalis TaxID=2498619 RepID=A0A371D679_9APHY|nr:hypothetical protein OH76DRAFT_695293 [Polyporus brumalis]
MFWSCKDVCLGAWAFLKSEGVHVRCADEETCSPRTHRWCYEQQKLLMTEDEKTSKSTAAKIRFQACSASGGGGGRVRVIALLSLWGGV